MNVSHFLIISVIITVYVSLASGAATSLNVSDFSGLKIINPKIEVYLTSLEDGYQDNWGYVNGVQLCGGYGELIQMKYETCYGPGVCQVPSDGVLRRAEMHFIPSDDISSLGFRITASTRGLQPTVVFDRGLENSNVWRGEKYSINAEVAASRMFQGRTISLQFELYREYDYMIELCSIAEFEIV